MTIAVRFLFVGVVMIAVFVWLGTVVWVFDDGERHRELSGRISRVDERVAKIEEYLR
jgi:hypothetical protein